MRSVNTDGGGPMNQGPPTMLIQPTSNSSAEPAPFSDEELRATLAGCHNPEETLAHLVRAVQVARAVRRLHRVIQHLAAIVAESHSRARAGHQAVLQPGVGQRLATAFQRGLRQRQPRPRTQVSRPQVRRDVFASRPLRRTWLANVQGPARLRRC